MATVSNTTKRASSLVPGIGQSLDKILGQDVIVEKVWIGDRSMDGEQRTIVLITLADGSLFHAWSDSLAEKIAEIPSAEFPLTFKFVKATTRRGFSVLTFE